MIQMIQKKLMLTRKGAADFMQAVLLTALTNISLMFPVGLLLAVIRTIIGALTNGTPVFTHTILIYTGCGALLLCSTYLLHAAQYKKTYLSTYNESENRRIRLAEQLRRLPLSFFGRKDLSDLTVAIMGDCSFIEQSFSHYLPQLFGSLISTVFTGICLFILDWRMAIASLWVIPLAFLVLFASKVLIDRFAVKNMRVKRAVTECLQEELETIREIQAYNRIQHITDKLRSTADEAERTAIRTELITGIPVTASQMILRIGIATTVLWGTKLYSSGDISLLVCLAFLIAASRLYDPLCTCLMHTAAVFNTNQHLHKLKEIADEPVQTGSTQCAPKTFDIEFADVSFSYDEKETVLQNVSFTAKQGTVTALVGPSGGGKSTAARLAARFWDADSGVITLGGIDISGIEPETLLMQYAIVFQDVTLFNGTIMENIRLGKLNASDEEVRAAARAAHCDQFVNALPDGYDTLIGENGSRLSGGERQRISIARAILKDAPIILLDEATASLDVENESAIQSALSHLLYNKTVLIIAHRLRTVINADQIIVLKDGRIIEQGAPAQLITQEGYFKQMAELQLQTDSWSLQ